MGGGGAEEKTAASTKTVEGGSGADPSLGETVAPRPSFNDGSNLALEKQEEALFDGRYLEPASSFAEKRAFEKDGGTTATAQADRIPIFSSYLLMYLFSDCNIRAMASFAIPISSGRSNGSGAICN